MSTKNTLMTKQAILAVSIGVVRGLVVAMIMTTLDWRLNPSGIFHNTEGTDWRFVRETAFSWFLPIASATSVVAAVLLYLISRLK